MRYWAGIVTQEQFTTERMYARDVIAIEPGADGEPNAGDLVALIAGTEPPVLFGFGRVTGRSNIGETLVTYHHRAMDDPRPVSDLDPSRPGPRPLSSTEFTRSPASRCPRRPAERRAGGMVRERCPSGSRRRPGRRGAGVRTYMEKPGRASYPPTYGPGATNWPCRRSCSAPSRTSIPKRTTKTDAHTGELAPPRRSGLTGEFAPPRRSRLTGEFAPLGRSRLTGQAA